MREMQNLPAIRPALILKSQTSNPIPLGDTGLWFDGTTTYFVKADGSKSVAGTASNTYKEACLLASTANIAGTYSATGLTLTVTATGRLSVDSVNVTNGDRILLKNQTTDSQNGIYRVTVQGATGTNPVLTRAPDANSSSQFEPGFLVPVSKGSVSADTIYEFTADAPFTLDSSSATFAHAPLAITYGSVGAMAASGATTANAAGTADAVARIDHVHAVDTAVVATLTGTQELTGKTLTAQVVKTGLTASGSASNDFSGSTGTFKTSTGLSTLSGDVLLAAGKIIGLGAPQALSGAGACNVTTLATLFTSTGSAQALTLADGTQAGQLKIVHHTVDGGSGVLTPATAGNFATFTLTNVHDACLLQWSGTAWNILLNVGGTVG